MTTPTYDEVLAAIEAAVERHPNRLNPVGVYNGCVYTSPSDPDHHCIAGQVLLDLGFHIPSAVDVDNDGTTVGELTCVLPFSDEVVNLLTEAQGIFDACTASGVLWHEALGELHERLDFLRARR